MSPDRPASGQVGGSFSWGGAPSFATRSGTQLWSWGPLLQRLETHGVAYSVTTKSRARWPNRKLLDSSCNNQIPALSPTHI